MSLPELPLLGVLPGTGGLTRVIDKRKVRRDLADIFCTTPDGVRGDRAKEWGLVDDVIKTQQFAEEVKKHAVKLAEKSDRPSDAKGVELTRVECTSTMPAGITNTSMSRSNRSAAARLSPCGPRRRLRQTQSSKPLRRARAGGLCKWRASSMMRSCTFEPTNSISAFGF